MTNHCAGSGLQRPAVALLMAGLLASLLCSTPAAAQSAPQGPALTGTATYRERSALPDKAVFEATIRDVTGSNGTAQPAELIGRTRIEPVQGIPIRFAIPYDPVLVKPGHRYTLQARIAVGDRLIFATLDPVPVLSDGRADPVAIVLARRSGVVIEDATQPVIPAPAGLSQASPQPLNPQPLTAQPLAPPSAAAPSLSAPSPTAPPPATPPTTPPPSATFPRQSPAAARGPDYLLRGLYRTTSAGARFVECGGSRPVPVAPEGGAGALAAAYQRGHPKPGEDALVEVEGRIAIGPTPDGASLGRVLAVDRFIGLRPGESCLPAETRAEVAVPTPSTASRPPAPDASSSSAPADSPLRGTYWRLVKVGAQTLKPASGRTPPYLVLNPDVARFSGNGGCNDLAGSFFLDGHYLTLKPDGASPPACTGGMELQQTVRDDIAATEGWSVAGNRLTLYDGDGNATLRFEAGYQN